MGSSGGAAGVAGGAALGSGLLGASGDGPNAGDSTHPDAGGDQQSSGGGGESTVTDNIAPELEIDQSMGDIAPGDGAGSGKARNPPGMTSIDGSVTGQGTTRRRTYHEPTFSGVPAAAGESGPSAASDQMATVSDADENTSTKMGSQSRRRSGESARGGPERETEDAVVLDDEAYDTLAGGDDELKQQLKARDELLDSKLADGNDTMAQGMSKEMAKAGVGAVVGAAVAGSGLGAAGMAGMALATGANVAATGMGGHLAAQSVENGVRETYNQAKTTFTDSLSSVSEYTRDTVSQYYSAGEGGSEGSNQANDHNLFNDER